MSLLKKGRSQINRNTYYANQLTQQLGYQQGVLPLLEEEKKEITAGLISAYIGATDPIGWMICNGRIVSRTMYPNLFALIGVDYGMGDGITTFNIPDLRGSFLRGSGTNDISNNYIGPALNKFQDHATESHSHTLTDPGHKHVLDSINNDYVNNSTGYSDSSPHSVVPSLPNNDDGTTQRWLNPIENATTGILVNDSFTNGNASLVETRPFNCGINWIIKVS